MSRARAASRAALGRFLAPLLLVVLVLLTFGRLLTADFVSLDDPETVRNNPRFNPPTVRSVAGVWTEPAGALYVPVTYSVWGVLSAIARVTDPDTGQSSPNPAVYHAANVVVHALTSVVVWLILRRLARGPWVAFAGAAIFALHPVQVETVGWVSGLKDLLGGLLSLVAIWQYLVAIGAAGALSAMPSDSTSQPCDEVRLRRLPWWLGLLAYAAAMLSKPGAVVAPVVAAAISVWVVGRPWRRVIGDLWPWFVLALPCAVWTRRFQDVSHDRWVPAWGRPLIATDALTFYLVKLAAPVGLTMDHGRRPDWTWASGAPLYTWILPAAVAAGVWLGRKRYPWLVAAAVVFVAALLPVLGFVPFMFQHYSTVAEHYLYLPMFGVALAVAGLCANTSPRHRSRLVGGAGAAIAVLGVLSAAQTGYWQNDFAFYGRMIEVNNRSFVGHNGLGRAFGYEGDLERAAASFQKGIAAWEGYELSHRNLGDVLLQLGKQRRDAALIERGLKHMERAMEIRAAQPEHTRPDDGPPRLTVGRYYLHFGRPDEARRQFELVLEHSRDAAAITAAREELARLAEGVSGATRATTSPSAATTTTSPGSVAPPIGP